MPKDIQDISHYLNFLLDRLEKNSGVVGIEAHTKKGPPRA
jgi:hypothetical protein